MYPLLEYHIDHLLELLESQSHPTQLIGAVFLLKEAICLMGFGGHPRTICHHLGHVQTLMGEDNDTWEDVMILFDCLKYLDEIYP